MKLFTIGDSISQGFMSGAAARTDLSYSSLIAKQLNIAPYPYPTWEKGGHPVNIEEVFRKLQKRLGADIAGPIEWPVALNIINNYLDEVEDYYERGPGSLPVSNSSYHNVAVRGFDVSSSWQVTPKLCSDYINASPAIQDNWWGMVDESFLRTARTVLSGGSIATQDFSQLGWLEYHHSNHGVENLILWLGANNALGTVLDINVRQTSNDGQAFANGVESFTYDMRRKLNWNLWHPNDFEAEYEYTINKVVNIMQNNPKEVDYKVFVGTVPLVTICPLIKAVGEMNDREFIDVIEWPLNGGHPAPISENELAPPIKATYSYGKYYTYFPFADSFEINDKHLNLQEVLHIDNCIREYNRIIQKLVMQTNKRLSERRFYLVDIGTALNTMALKRNNLQPTYEFPEYFKFVYPRLDTRYYGTTRKGEIKAGGLFSLDGVHPTAIGQGLLAYEFLKIMKVAGSYQGNPAIDLNWKEIFESDDLYSKPINLLSEIYDNAELAKWVMQMIDKI